MGCQDNRKISRLRNNEGNDIGDRKFFFEGSSDGSVISGRRRGKYLDSN
jgi:hypothetical protein